MARPNQSARRRKELLPIIARAFADLGYRRTTTAKLAGRCKVQENILYRLWPDKKSMFIAVIDHVYENSVHFWKKVLEETEGARSGAEEILDYESRHHGELGLYRIVFAGLSETDDPDIQAALRRMYGRFHRFLKQQISDHRHGHSKGRELPEADLCAWAAVGLGTAANISNELGLLSERRRRRLIRDVGRLLIEGRTP